MKRILTLILSLTPVWLIGQTFPKMLIIENDSCIVFTLGQAKRLISWDYEKEKYKADLIVCEFQSAYKDSVIKVNTEALAKFNEVVALYDKQIDETNKVRLLLAESQKLLVKEVRKQKFRKFLIGVGGFISTAVMTYLFISK